MKDLIHANASRFEYLGANSRFSSGTKVQLRQEKNKRYIAYRQSADYVYRW